MNYAAMGKEIEEAVERFVQLGISREVVERELKVAEWAFLADLTQSHKDNQLLLCFAEHGSKACAERWEVSPRTIRDWRQAALNRRAARHPISAAG